MTVYVALDKVSKQYGQQLAVNQVCLNLKAGECIGLAGHNGAGKSTLIKLILGLMMPTQGNISLFGHQNVGSVGSAIRSQIGYLPETVTLHPSLTGKETLDFYAKLKGQSCQHNMELLAKVGIAQSAHKRVGAYSKGMRQRLALAQALLGEPKVLLFDEPTTGLDPASRQMFYQLIEEWKQKGASILLSTHALAELDGHADRVVVMKNGNKIADGNMHELQIQSGLPATIKVRLKQATVLPSYWQCTSDGYVAQCRVEDKAKLLQDIKQLDNIVEIDIHTPSLDEMYAQLLKREDI